jgi:hypothetical protein
MTLALLPVANGLDRYFVFSAKAACVSPQRAHVAYELRRIAVVDRFSLPSGRDFDDPPVGFQPYPHHCRYPFDDESANELADSRPQFVNTEKGCLRLPDLGPYTRLASRLRPNSADRSGATVLRRNSLTGQNRMAKRSRPAQSQHRSATVAPMARGQRPQERQPADGKRIDDGCLHQIQREGYPARKIADTVFDKRFTGANSATPATTLTGAATSGAIRFPEESSGESYCAQNCTGSVCEILVFNSSEQIGNENSRNEKRKKRLVTARIAKSSPGSRSSDATAAELRRSPRP